MSKIEEFEDPSSRYQNPRYSGKKPLPRAWVGNAMEGPKPILNSVPNRAGNPNRRLSYQQFKRGK